MNVARPRILNADWSPLNPGQSFRTRLTMRMQSVNSDLKCWKMDSPEPCRIRVVPICSVPSGRLVCHRMIGGHKIPDLIENQFNIWPRGKARSSKRVNEGEPDPIWAACGISGGLLAFVRGRSKCQHIKWLAKFCQESAALGVTLPEVHFHPLQVEFAPLFPGDTKSKSGRRLESGALLAYHFGHSLGSHWRDSGAEIRLCAPKA
jgi:hypothetical protein